MWSASGDIRFARSYLFASFGLVQNYKRTPLDKDVQRMNVTCALVYGLSVLVQVVQFSYVWHPLGILYVSVNVRSTQVVNAQL